MEQISCQFKILTVFFEQRKHCDIRSKTEQEKYFLAAQSQLKNEKYKKNESVEIVLFKNRTICVASQLL